MINWLKRNWLSILLIIIIVFLLNNSLGINTSSLSIPTISNYDQVFESSSLSPMGYSGSSKQTSQNSLAPNNTQRMVITDSYLSLMVKSTTEVMQKIESTAKEMGGFMVNTNVSRPEYGGTGSITVRVPTEKRTEAINAFKKLSVKTVSENVIGTDITDNYSDLDARLEILNTTKAKYQSLLNSAVIVSDILSVQKELTNIQAEIDNIMGQKQYYEQANKLSKITVSLSTDELALPYSPDSSWRPALVFKQAVRSLISSFRSLGNLAIWLFVFAPIWLLILLITLFIIRRKRKLAKVQTTLD